MLKFEKTAKVGDLIKAFDFEPIPDRQDRYIVGRVIKKVVKETDYAHYLVKVICHWSGDNVEHFSNNTMKVPMQIGGIGNDYDNRITKCAEIILS